MSLPRYPDYKNSGLEWLGEVPAHWNIVPLKAVSTHNDDVLDEATPADIEIQYVDISSVDAVHGITAKEAMPFFAAPARARRCVRHGDVIISTVRTYLRAVAKIANPEDNLIVSTGFSVIRPSDGLSPNFLGHLATGSYFVDQVIARSTGVSYPAINARDLARIPVPLPSVPEQEIIAAFLDRETAKIDALVAEQERLIELLKEKRRAVISHAVTKGLNPDVPTKPSGVDWLGDVPRHWTVLPLRSIASVVRGASPRPAGDPRYFNGNHLPWITVAEITKDTSRFLSETEAFLTAEGAQFSRLFPRGTVLYSNSGATLGVPKILDIDGCANDGVIGFLDLDASVRSEFLYRYLESTTNAIREKVKQGSGQPNLNTEIVKDLRLALPPLAEQDLILQHMTESLDANDSLAVDAQRAIALFRERRSALISAAVTGEIDVRGLVNPEVA